MGRSIIKTSLLGRLFPRLPSEQTLKARRAANVRTVVQKVSSGSYLLQASRYLTEDDIQDKRRRVLGTR